MARSAQRLTHTHIRARAWRGAPCLTHDAELRPESDVDDAAMLQEEARRENVRLVPAEEVEV